MKKLILLSLLLIMAVGVQAASLRQIQLEITNEFWQPVNNITQITVFDAGTSDNATIFSDRAGTISMTNPITTSSTNTTFDQSLGFVRWFQRAPDYKVTITDASKTLTIDNRTGSVTRFPWFDNYIGTAASLSVNDNQEIVVGTDSDGVLSWNNSESAITWIPASDGSDFDIGSTTATSQFNFNVFVGGIGGGGLIIDEGAATFVWTGGAFSAKGGTINLNAGSNNITNINTGTSTGAVNIGSSTAGNVTLDTTSALSLNADDSVTITASAGTIDLTAPAGTIDITSTGGGSTITIDSTASQLLLDAAAQADDAIVITATGTAGGIDITSLGDIDITTTGTAGEDITITNTGGSINFTATEADAGAIVMRASAAGGDVNIDSVLGRIEIEAEEDVANALFLIADGGASSSIRIFNDTGISATDAAASIQITSDLGGIELLSSLAAANQIRLNAAGTVAGNAVVLETTNGGILLNADDASNGDIELNSADDMTFTVAGDLVFAVTGDTTLPNDMLRKATVAIADTEMDILENTQKELVAAVAGQTIEFVSAIFALDWGSTAWTEPTAPDDLVIRYENGTGAIVSRLLDATGFATATEDTVLFLDPTVANAAGAAVAGVGVTEANSTNKALVLDNTGSDWTNSGDSQVVVIVYYRLHTTAELGL